MILFANLFITVRKNVPLGALFIGLFATLGIAYLVPIRALLPLGAFGQWVGGGLLVASPILFCGNDLCYTLPRSARMPPPHSPQIFWVQLWEVYWNTLRWR